MKKLLEKMLADSLNTVRNEFLERINEYQENNSVLGNENLKNISERDEKFPIIEYPKKNFQSQTPCLKNSGEVENNFKKSDFQKQFVPKSEKPICSDNKIGMLNAYNKNKRLNIMILGAVFGLVFCLLMLTFYKGDLPGEVVGIISTVAGIFGSCLKDAYSFEFGSSRGSKDKDDKITSTLLEKLKI